MTATTRAEVEREAKALRLLGHLSLAERILALLARAEAAEATLVSVLDKVRREHEPAQEVCEALSEWREPSDGELPDWFAVTKAHDAWRATTDAKEKPDA